MQSPLHSVYYFLQATKIAEQKEKIARFNLIRQIKLPCVQKKWAPKRFCIGK